MMPENSITFLPCAFRIPVTSSYTPFFLMEPPPYIGYPIWWGIAAWPVNQFVTGNDFTGKAVIPFCTSASSGLGQSGTLLAEAAGTGEWLEGARFSYGTEEADVQAWVNSLADAIAQAQAVTED